MARPTLEAVPFSDIQGQRIDDVTTMPTAFTAGEPTVNFNQRSPIPLALVIELTYQLSSGVGGGSFPRQTRAPGSITDTECKLMVFHHILNGQILNYDGLVFAYQLSCQFMEKVFTAIRNFAVRPCNFDTGFLSVI